MFLFIVLFPRCVLYDSERCILIMNRGKVNKNYLKIQVISVHSALVCLWKKRKTVSITGPNNLSNWPSPFQGRFWDFPKEAEVCAFSMCKYLVTFSTVMCIRTKFTGDM